MSSVPEIIKQIETLTDQDRYKIFNHLAIKLNVQQGAILGKNYEWWNNKDDDVYNES